MGTNDYFACNNLYEYVKDEECKSVENEIDYALIWNPDKWPREAGSYKAKLFVVTEEEEGNLEQRRYLPPPYNPNPVPTAPPVPPPPLPPPPLPSPKQSPTNSPTLNKKKYKGLRRELEQCKKDIRDFPFKQYPIVEEKETGIFPLREVPSGLNQGVPVIGYVQEPLRATEVRAFKKETRSMIDDPLGASEQLENLLGPNIYTWDEMTAIQERQLIRAAAMKVWERDHPPNLNNNIQGADKFPLVRPNWDNNNQAHRTNMEDLRNIIIRGIKEAVPKAQNMSKAMNLEQEKEESPAAFLQRPKDTMRKYSGMDPDDDINSPLVRVQFVTKAWPDISKKLQKLDGREIDK